MLQYKPIESCHEREKQYIYFSEAFFVSLFWVTKNVTFLDKRNC